MTYEVGHLFYAYLPFVYFFGEVSVQDVSPSLIGCPASIAHKFTENLLWEVDNTAAVVPETQLDLLAQGEARAMGKLTLCYHLLRRPGQEGKSVVVHSWIGVGRRRLGRTASVKAGQMVCVLGPHTADSEDPDFGENGGCDGMRSKRSYG